MKRQEIERVSGKAGRQKKRRPSKRDAYVSLNASGKTGTFWEILLRYGKEGVSAAALLVFLLLCGSELPYKVMSPVYFVGLRRLEIPDASLLKGMNIQTLKADAGGTALPVQRGDQERRILWDIPHFSYRINRNDTISQISRQYHISVGTLLSVNNIENVKKMAEGEVLIIPEVEGLLYTSGKEETLEDIILRFDADRKGIVQYNPYLALVNKSLTINTGQELFIPGAVMSEGEMRERMGELFIYPVPGRVLKGYGRVIDEMTQIETFHNGIDIKGETGDAVRAALDGRVIAAGFNSSYGNYLILEHQGGYRSLYAQLQSSTVLKNNKVLQGEMIATVGTSGYARVPHLHFSLFKGKKSIDPLDYLH